MPFFTKSLLSHMSAMALCMCAAVRQSEMTRGKVWRSGLDPSLVIFVVLPLMAGIWSIFQHMASCLIAEAVHLAYGVMFRLKKCFIAVKLSHCNEGWGVMTRPVVISSSVMWRYSLWWMTIINSPTWCMTSTTTTLYTFVNLLLLEL